MFYLNNPVRDMLNKMIRWHIYLEQGKPVDMGILDSNMAGLLGDDLFAVYKKSYPSAEYEKIREAFDAVIELWHKTAVSVAEKCGFSYPEETGENMLSFIRNL